LRSTARAGGASRFSDAETTDSSNPQAVIGGASATRGASKWGETPKRAGKNQNILNFLIKYQ